MDPTSTAQLGARIGALCAAANLHERLGELVNLCEELELLTLSTSVAPMAVEHYARFLIALLALRRLDEARHLWKRLPVKNGAGLPQIWAVGQALWKRDIVQAHAAVGALVAVALEGFAPLVAVLKHSIQHSTALLISRAYSNLPLDSTAQALGLSVDEAVTFCVQHNWRVEQNTVFPSPLPSSPSVAIELDQLQHLSSYILHLEQRSIMKV
ncbi:COP9 signalosome complex subunit [Achlya hypogyna]|uniref:COP9 signalosome complex subunit 8 n=1 Tax=Achlya hypogyna TaxID=1202772 RepID=A0A1V9YP81_ACHHY|nr:COP9 signalosome complex subunit [Achlya hypogyna]